MKTRVVKMCLIPVAATLLASGCVTEQPVLLEPSKDVSEQIAKVDAADGPDEVSVTTISDGNFSYTMGDEQTRKFVQINPNATLNDLNDFAIAVCWNNYLKPRIEACEEINREDAVLLDFCMKAELNMVDTLAVAALGDMTQPGYLHDFIVKMEDASSRKSGEIEGIYRDEAEVFVRLKCNFLKADTGIRRPMKNWANKYQSIPPETLKIVFDSLQDSSKRADVSNGSHPWLWGSAYAAGAILGGVVGTSFVGGLHALSADNLNSTEENMRDFNATGSELSEAWKGARNRMGVYLPEVVAMRRTLERAKQQMTDSQSRKYLQTVLDESENDKLQTAMYLDYALYDLPLVVSTCKARARLKKCQGIFNDDEKAMMSVMADYNTAVSGASMLKHIRSPYAANAYAELIKYFKAELSDREFKDFVHESRLYDVEIGVDNSGMSDNKLTPIGQPIGQ